MGTKTLKALAVSVLAVAMTSIGSPARAGSATISDPAGVDYYLGDDATDLSAVSLETGGGFVTASWTIDGFVPPAGGTSFPPSDGITSYGYKVLFQNRDKQTGLDNGAGGCTTLGGVRLPDTRGNWLDGYHSFIGFDMTWKGAGWTHRAAVGTYDPSPGGGFVATELGTSSGPGVWTDSDPSMPYGSTWSVSLTGTTISLTVSGVVSSSNPVCFGGVFPSAHVTPGDRIVNVKGLSTFGNELTLPIVLPVEVPKAPTVMMPVTGAGRTVCAVANELGLGCLVGSATTVGGITNVSDVTAGNSTTGAYGTNVPNISWTPGLVGAVDTLGPGPRCPWPTFGGVLPPNPLHSPTQRCHVDDDAISRGSYFAEWWDTPYGFTA